MRWCLVKYIEGLSGYIYIMFPGLPKQFFVNELPKAGNGVIAFNMFKDMEHGQSKFFEIQLSHEQEYIGNPPLCQM